MVSGKKKLSRSMCKNYLCLSKVKIKPVSCLRFHNISAPNVDLKQVPLRFGLLSEFRKSGFTGIRTSAHEGLVIFGNWGLAKLKLAGQKVDRCGFNKKP